MLHGINLSVAPGEIVAIMGRNGMGKTTLMKSLMGILPAKSGSDHAWTAPSVSAPAELSSASPSGLAYVPQGRHDLLAP